jgi:hypothetical protein
MTNARPLGHAATAQTITLPIGALSYEEVEIQKKTEKRYGHVGFSGPEKPWAFPKTGIPGDGSQPRKEFSSIRIVSNYVIDTFLSPNLSFNQYRTNKMISHSFSAQQHGGNKECVIVSICLMK